MEKDLSGTYTEYAFDKDGNPEAENNRGSSNGGWVDSWVYFEGQHIAHYENGGVYYIYSNQVGTAGVVTDWTGAVIQDELHYPWGKVWTTMGAQTEERFASLHHRDSATNLDPTHFRMYSSDEGRWLTPDPAQADIFHPQSMSRYAYAGGNPSDLTDSTGLNLVYFPPGYGCGDPFVAVGDASCGSGGWAWPIGPIFPPIGLPRSGGGGGGIGTGSGFANIGRPCLDAATQQALTDKLLEVLGAALGMTLSRNQVHVGVNSSGAETITLVLHQPISVSSTNLGVLDPPGITEIFHPGGIYNMGGRIPMRLPGGAGSAHIVFHGTVDPGGQTITLSKQVEIHGDIEMPKGDLASILAHLTEDGIWSKIGHVIGGGCVVKFQ